MRECVVMLVRSALALALLPACVSEMTEIETATEESAILGGTDVPIGKWQDAAAIRTNSSWYCSGTLIAPNVVITAGHCAPDAPNNVLVGTSSLQRPTEGEVIPVKMRIEYPSSQRSADLLVLLLERDSKFEPRPIATGWARAEIKNGASVQIVGFGAIDMDGNQFTPTLKEATTTITDADCTMSSGCQTAVKPTICTLAPFLISARAQPVAIGRGSNLESRSRSNTRRSALRCELGYSIRILTGITSPSVGRCSELVPTSTLFGASGAQ
jgi:secreted trypsin-like serine protease